MTAVARVDSKVGLLKSRLERMSASLTTILGNEDAATREKLLVMLYFQQRPGLQQCDVESIAESVLQIAQWGLVLGSEAHIVPQGGKACARKDYKGEIKMAIRGKRIAAYWHKTVGDGDDFEVIEGVKRDIVHRPNWQKPGATIGAYAIVTLPDGSTDFEVMNRDQIEAVRRRSPAKDKGPWVTDWDEMAKKTVGRRLLKRYLGDIDTAEDGDPGDGGPVGVTHVKADPYRELDTPAPQAIAASSAVSAEVEPETDEAPDSPDDLFAVTPPTEAQRKRLAKILASGVWTREEADAYSVAGEKLNGKQMQDAIDSLTEEGKARAAKAKSEA